MSGSILVTGASGQLGKRVVELLLERGKATRIIAASVPRRGSDLGRDPSGVVAYTGALPALVAQWIEHLTTDQKVGGSNPSERAEIFVSDGSR